MEEGDTEPASVTSAFVFPGCGSGQALRKGPSFSDEGDSVKLFLLQRLFSLNLSVTHNLNLIEITNAI